MVHVAVQLSGTAASDAYPNGEQLCVLLQATQLMDRDGAVSFPVLQISIRL